MSQSVIAIGKRGGKIIGYKAGKPVYLQEEDQPKPKYENFETAVHAETPPIFSSEGVGAMGVIPKAKWEAEIDPAKVKPESKYTMKNPYRSLKKQGAIMEVRKEWGDNNNRDAVLEQVTSNVMDLLYDPPFASPETHLADLGEKQLGRLIIHDPEVDTSKAPIAGSTLRLDSQFTPRSTKFSKIVSALTSMRESDIGPVRTAELMDGLVRQRLIMLAAGAVDSSMDIKGGGNFMMTFFENGQASVDQSAPAFAFDPAVAFSPEQHTNTAKSFDPVLAAVFSVIQKDKELALEYMKAAAASYTHHESSVFTNAEKIKSIKGLVAALATPVGRMMGDAKTFATRANALISEVASLNANALSFAKHCASGVIENFENFGSIEEIPVAPTDKPVPQAMPTSDEDVAKLAEAAPEPEAAAAPEPEAAPEPTPKLADALKVKGALKDVEVLRGSTQGGIIGTLKGQKVIIKGNKDSDRATSEVAGSTVIRALLGESACAEAVKLSGQKAAGKIKGTGFSGSNMVMVQYIENDGTIPKKGVQIEAKLTADQKAELVALSMASWCISDGDAHGGNFLIGKDGSLFRVDTGQAGVYSHMDGNPANYQYGPNSNPIAFNDLLLYYAGQYTDEATDCSIDFNHPKILEALERIETEGKKLSGSGLIGLAKGRSKMVRKHFEGMISEAMKMRSGDSSYSFSFGDGSKPPAWSSKTPDGADKQPNKAHHFKKAFGGYDVLKSMGTGVNQAQEIRSHADGAKYILKKFSGSKKISAVAETIASNIAHRLMPPTISENGQSYFPTVPAFLVNDGSSSGATVLQQKAFNKGNVGSSTLTEKQSKQVLAASVVRWIIGDHDGHSQQYMFSSPASGEADIISIDFGNAWKHSASEATSFDEGYHQFNPQSPPPKLDRGIYQGLKSGSLPITLITENPALVQVIENIEQNASDIIAMSEDYWAEVEKKNKSAAKKGRATFEHKVNNVRALWEEWVYSIMESAGVGGVYSVGGTAAEVKKSIVLKGLISQPESMYKAIMIIDEEALMDEEGTHTEFALRQLKRFAEVCYIISKDQPITREQVRSSTELTMMRLQMPSLTSEFNEILNDPESRRLSL